MYVAASVGIVFAGSVAALTGLRFVQGLSAAAGMVLSMAIVRDSFEGYQIGKVIARLMLVVGVALLVGVGPGRVEERVERHLRVDHDALAPRQVDHQVGPQ